MNGAILKVATFDKVRLSIMTTLHNMMGKTGHNRPGLSQHQRLLAEGHRIRSV